MGDNGNDLSREQSPQPAEKPQPDKPKDLVLMITLHQDTGQISVQAPGNGQMFDEPISFWLLEKAKDFIKAVNNKMSQSRIVPANPSMAQQVRGMFNKFRRH